MELRLGHVVHDPSRPLRLVVERRRRVEAATVEEISYDGGTSGRIAAFVVRPAGASPADGVVIGHGGFEGGKHLFVEQALELARAGTTVLAADVPFPRSGDAAAVADAFRAAVVTHRRSLDVLEAVYGARSLGLFGHSRGGQEAAILSAVEPRLRAVVIAGMGSASEARRRAARAETAARDYLEAILGFDAGSYLAVPAPRRLLVQHGRQDAEVTLAEARAMFAAASGPKLWREYDCGHGVDGHPAARADRIAFFRDALPPSRARVP